MLPSNIQPARTSQMLNQTAIINIDFSLFRSAVSSPHGDYGAQHLMDVCMDRWCVCGPLNCRLCLSYFYITQVLLLNAKPCGMSLKKCPLFAIVARMHAFAWIQTAQELVDRIQADQTYRTRAFSMS